MSDASLTKREINSLHEEITKLQKQLDVALAHVEIAADIAYDHPFDYKDHAKAIAVVRFWLDNKPSKKAKMIINKQVDKIEKEFLNAV
jgi:hypothetical protein